MQTSHGPSQTRKPAKYWTTQKQVNSDGLVENQNCQIHSISDNLFEQESKEFRGN